MEIKEEVKLEVVLMDSSIRFFPFEYGRLTKGMVWHVMVEVAMEIFKNCGLEMELYWTEGEFLEVETKSLKKKGGLFQRVLQKKIQHLDLHDPNKETTCPECRKFG